MICFFIIYKSIKDIGSSFFKIIYKNLIMIDLSMIKKLIISGSYLEMMYIDLSISYIYEVF